MDNITKKIGFCVAWKTKRCDYNIKISWYKFHYKQYTMAVNIAKAKRPIKTYFATTSEKSISPSKNPGKNLSSKT